MSVGPFPDCNDMAWITILCTVAVIVCRPVADLMIHFGSKEGEARGDE